MVWVRGGRDSGWTRGEGDAEGGGGWGAVGWGTQWGVGGGGGLGSEGGAGFVVVRRPREGVWVSRECVVRGGCGGVGAGE